MPRAFEGSKVALDALAGQLGRNGHEFQIICRNGVAPYILYGQSTQRFPGTLVHGLEALLSARKEMVFSPLAQGDDYWEQFAALLG